MDPKKAVRKAIVERVGVYKRSDYDEVFSDFVDDGHPEVWIAQITTGENWGRPSRFSMFFLSESEATEYVLAHPVGSEFNNSDQEGAETEDAASMTVRTYVDDGYFPNSMSGLILSSMPMEQLLKAGIFERTGRVSTLLYDGDLGGKGPIQTLSKMVLDFTGEQRVSELKELFGGDWEHAAAWEYCYVKFPHSSFAYIAAAHDYNLFVLRDNLTAGYLLRDLEVLVRGIEAEAAKFAEGKRKRAKGSGEASAKSRKGRIESLLSAMEKFSKRNPDIAERGDRVLAD